MEPILDFLLDERKIRMTLIALAIIGPVVGAMVAFFFPARPGNRGNLRVWSFSIGFAFPVVYFLWLLYNRICDGLGLDRVVNLAANLILFAVVGILYGLIFGFLVRKYPPAPKA